jgi:hypothetical protein
MVPRIDGSDSEEKDEETQLNGPQIEEEEVEEEQQVAESSRAPSIVWLCFDKSTVFTKNDKEIAGTSKGCYGTSFWSTLSYFEYVSACLQHFT